MYIFCFAGETNRVIQYNLRSRLHRRSEGVFYGVCSVNYFRGPPTTIQFEVVGQSGKESMATARLCEITMLCGCVAIFYGTPDEIITRNILKSSSYANTSLICTQNDPSGDCHFLANFHPKIRKSLLKLNRRRAGLLRSFPPCPIDSIWMTARAE